MDDKRSTQLSLPLVYDPLKVKEYAKQSWNMTFARQKKVSVYAKRIIGNVLAMIRDDDKEFRAYYEMRAIDVIQDQSKDKSSIYKELKKAFEELAGMFWMFEDEKSQKFKPKHLLNTNDDDARCEYTDGKIYIALNPSLSKYFIELSHYTTYELTHYMQFKSWYSMRIFELLSVYRDTGTWTVSIAKFRELMDCSKKYKNVNDLIKYTLSEPLEELEKTKLAFTYEFKFTDKVGRGRPSIDRIVFTIKNVVGGKTIEEMKAYSAEHKQILELLMGTYLIDEKVILKYAKPIGMKQIKELIKAWYNLKNENKITNIKAYCNKVFQEVGKKAIEEIEAKLNIKES